MSLTFFTKIFVPDFCSKEQAMSLLETAANGSTSRCRQLLAAGSHVGERDEGGLTPLLVAAYLGHTGVCELLVERGKANIEEIEPGGNTALNLAATKGNASTVALLLSKGAKVDTKNNDDFTPLLAAVDKGHTEVCELLLAADSDVEESELKAQFTPLHFAAIHGYEKIIQLLLSHKAEVNSRDRIESTPLFCASQEGHAACVVTLLQAGADPMLFDEDGYLPIHLAADNNHPEVVRILIEEGECSPDQVRHTALQSLDRLFNSFLIM